MPVTVWKQVMRNKEDSNTSRPVRSEDGTLSMAGVSDFVMAWTLQEVPRSIRIIMVADNGDKPMECSRKNEVVISGEFVESCGEIAVVDQATGFVDDDK